MRSRVEAALDGLSAIEEENGRMKIVCGAKIKMLVYRRNGTSSLPH